MKIKNISCTQFAGVRDRSVSLEDGINVIFGKNESGKSTLVNLLSRTLFQKAKLDKRSDKDFVDLYFPGARKGSAVVGDFADGKITIETENGTYTLSKEWGSDARCTLSTPDGVIRDQKMIDAVLKDVLLYGEGVYSDILLSTQYSSETSLQTIMDASKKTDAKQEITHAVSQAFAESDGISVDAIEQAIAAKIEEIAGKHWDSEREAPVRKAGRWTNSLGEILKAYYALEDAKAVLEEISGLEAEADRAAADYTEKDAAVAAADEAHNRFSAFASRLAVQSERKKAMDRINQDLRKIAEILSNWPALSEELAKARVLQKEKADRETLDQFNAAKKISDEIRELDSGAARRPCPTDAEIGEVRTAQRSVTTLENKLCGMNLNAAIRMLGGNTVEITSLRTGEAVTLSDGAAAITEAVKITVPGVMELQLSPANVDVAAVEEQIARQKKAVGDVFARYQVKTLDELETLAKTISDAKGKLDTASSRLAMLLGAVSFEELEAAVSAITDPVRAREEIERDILGVCGSSDVARFVTAKETVLDGYAAEYGSINDLKARAFDLDAELKKLQESVSGAEDIPAEYLSISDPDAHLAALKNTLESGRKLRENALNAKISAVSRLESYKENLSGDPAAEVEKTQRIFEEQKSLLSHWRHIDKVFKEQKESIHDNPMQDIADGFARYLARISDGKVSSEFPEADKLNMNIYSDNKLLDYRKLSEGTKDTVSLAFRLAVIDHLFPSGGGVIVLDDPFTDMDADRMTQACDLVREAAKRHQVIFLTCREDYLNLLEGNRVFFE